jgi:Phospholipase_D-nuclease N-terminal
VRILLGIVIVLFLILWARAVIDVFRRHDLSGGGKAGWAIFMLILPFIGLLVYTMLRPANV